MALSGVEAALAERMAQMLGTANEAISALMRRRGDYLALGGDASDRIEDLLRQYHAQQGVLCADGQRRRLPSEADGSGPIVVTLSYTADRYQSVTEHCLSMQGELVTLTDSGWSRPGSPDGEPDGETVCVEITVHHGTDGVARGEVDGDQYRDLESAGVWEQFLTAWAHMDPDRAQELLEQAQPEGMKP